VRSQQLWQKASAAAATGVNVTKRLREKDGTIYKSGDGRTKVAGDGGRRDEGRMDRRRRAAVAAAATAAGGKGDGGKMAADERDGAGKA
jgi:hypothetical protein